MIAYVLGPDPQGDHSVVGVFDVSDANLEVIATGVLRAGELTEVDVPSRGLYLVRGFVPGAKQLSAVLQVHGISNETSIAHLQGPTATAASQPAARGWIAVWRPNPFFEPVDGAALQASGTELTVGYTAAAGENAILQWVTDDGKARCATAPTGAPVRFADGHRLEPDSDEARVLLGFLDQGDPTHAAVLAETALGSVPADAALAAAAGYYLLSIGDARLENWSRQLIERWPRMFDAHLLRAWACLYDADSWPQAGAALRDATRCGLPLAARGLRLLDDALRRVSTVMDQDPETLRTQFLPYLRAVDDAGLTSFTGSPDGPGATGSVEPPPHARTWNLRRGRLHLGEPVSEQTHRPLAEAPGRRRFTAPLVLAGARGTGGPTTADMIVLDLPTEAREALGSAVTARVLPEQDSLAILFAPVPDLPIMVSIDESEQEWHSAERLSDAIAIVRIPWAESDTPRAIRIAVGETPTPAVESPLDALRSRLRAFSRSTDLTLVLDPIAVAEADASLTAVREQSADPDTRFSAYHAAGWLHWYRFLASDPKDMSSLYLAVELLAIVARERPDAVPEELRESLAVDGPPPSASPADRAAWQLRLALGTTEDAAPLDDAIGALREAAGDRPEHLANLAAGLAMRFERRGNRQDLEEAITLMRDVVGRTPRDDPRLAGTLSNLGGALRSLADLTGDDSVLDESVEIGLTAVDAAENGDPYLAGHLSNLAAALQLRFSRWGELTDAQAAINAGLRALTYAAPDDVGRPLMWNNLALTLRNRFERTGDLADLNGAIDASREAVSATEPGHPNRAAALSNLAIAARMRYEHRGEIADADAAIEAAREAADLLEETSPARVAVLTNLSAALQARHRNDLEATRFDEAVSVAAAAVEITTRTGGPSQEAGPALTALLSALVARYGVTGDLADLDNAVTAARAAVEAPSRTSGDRAVRLGNLSDALRLRYNRRGAPTDLDEAIKHAETALSRTSPQDPTRAGRLTALSNGLAMRAARTLALSDLDRSVTAAQAAAEALPDDHPDQAAAQSNLGVALRMRYAKSRNLADLDAAISAGRKASAVGEPQRALPSQANLATALRLRSETTGEAADLEEAVDLCRQVLDRLPDDHPSRSPILASLGNCMMLRYERSGAASDLTAAADAWWEAGQVASAPAATRFEALRALATSAATRDDWNWATRAYTAAAGLIPVLAWHGVDRVSREDLLTATVDIAADAAAACLAASASAGDTVELLDSSRAVIWGQLLDARSDLEALRARHPELVNLLEATRSRLESPADVTDSVPGTLITQSQIWAA